MIRKLRVFNKKILLFALLLSIMGTLPCFGETVLVEEGVEYVNENVETEICSGAIKLIGDVKDAELSAGWYYVADEVEYLKSLTINGDVAIILCDSAKLVVVKDILFLKGSKLTIYGQTDNTGELIVGVNQYEDGIIANWDAKVEFVVNGGCVTVQGKIDSKTNGGYDENVVGGDVIIIVRGEGHVVVEGYVYGGNAYSYSGDVKGGSVFVTTNGNGNFIAKGGITGGGVYNEIKSEVEGGDVIATANGNGSITVWYISGGYGGGIGSLKGGNVNINVSDDGRIMIREYIVGGFGTGDNNNDSVIGGDVNIDISKAGSVTVEGSITAGDGYNFVGNNVTGGNTYIDINGGNIDVTGSTSGGHCYSDSVKSGSVTVDITKGIAIFRGDIFGDGVYDYDSDSIVDGRTEGSESTVNCSAKDSVIFVNKSSSSFDNTTTDSILFKRNTGTVYSDCSIPDDFAIKDGQTLIIPKGSTVTIPDGIILTNRGIITGSLIIKDGGELKVDIDDSFFDDVNQTDWFLANVNFVVEQGLFSGVSENKFEPNAPMTRAMFITVLARHSGVEIEGGETWYEKAMQWGAMKGLTDGSNPNGNITREQIAVILLRYAGSYEGSLERAGELTFTDAESVSDWAVNGLRLVAADEIIRGYPDGSVNPQGNATRAEVATIVKKFIEILK